jgi:aspartyl-tRNA(Asn)/glutamyl-tRNA(Gln) amidotransferase subunit A
MPEFRLTGKAVRAIRKTTSIGAMARATWSVSARDFNIPELLQYADAELESVDPAPIPIQGRASHHWDDQELGVPAATGKRTSGTALRKAFESGATTPSEVLEKVLAAHEELGERSPFIEVDTARARKAAAAADERWKNGEPRGPLDGLIIPVKDEFHMRGLPTRGGTTYNEEIQSEDAWIVDKLEAAGAIVLGKTHATEWGMNPNGMLQHFVGPRNVYDDDHAPGGSSTGSGVATALGLCPSAVGSDGGGSIRIPASYNGIFGIKPTYIRVGRTGDTWSDSTVAHIGPLGQTVADCVEQLAATAGIDPDDPLTTWAPDEHESDPWHRALGRGVRGARIGICRDELGFADPVVADAVLDTASALQAEGAELIDIDLPFGPVMNAIGVMAIGCETMGNLQYDFAKYADHFGDELAILISMLSGVKSEQYMLAARARAALRRQVAEIFQDVDLLILPTTVDTACTYPRALDRTAVLDPAATAGATRFNFLANLTGLPAGTVPAGEKNGLPIGVQFVGDAWDEGSVIAAMAHCERLGLHDSLPRPEGFIPLLD